MDRQRSAPLLWNKNFFLNIHTFQTHPKGLTGSSWGAACLTLFCKHQRVGRLLLFMQCVLESLLKSEWKCELFSCDTSDDDSSAWFMLTLQLFICWSLIRRTCQREEVCHQVMWVCDSSLETAVWCWNLHVYHLEQSWQSKMANAQNTNVILKTELTCWWIIISDLYLFSAVVCLSVMSFMHVDCFAVSVTFTKKKCI